MIQYYRDPEAERLSIALWDLARPDRPAEDRADRMFNVVEAEDGTTFLEVDTDFEFVVDPAAVIGDLAGILQPRLSESAIADLGALIVSVRGQRVVASATFAVVCNGQPLDPQEMIDAGWVAQPGGWM